MKHGQLTFYYWRRCCWAFLMMADTPWGWLCARPVRCMGCQVLCVSSQKSMGFTCVIGWGCLFPMASCPCHVGSDCDCSCHQKARSEGVDLQGSKPNTIDGVYGPTSIDVTERARWGKELGLIGDD